MVDSDNVNRLAIDLHLCDAQKSLDVDILRCIQCRKSTGLLGQNYVAINMCVMELIFKNRMNKNHSRSINDTSNTINGKYRNVDLSNSVKIIFRFSKELARYKYARQGPLLLK